MTRVYQPGSFLEISTCGNTAVDSPAGSQTYSGARVSGSGWRAQLWAAPGADQPQSALQPAFPMTTFRTGGAAGTVVPLTATLTGVPVDCPVATVQLRVWPAFHATFEEAQTNWPPGAGSGKSCLFNVYAVGGGTNSPPDLMGFRSFSLDRSQFDRPVQPVVYVPPLSQSAPIGGTVVLTAEAACPAILAYEWTFNDAKLTSGVYDYIRTTNFYFFTYPPPVGEAGHFNYFVSSDYSLGHHRTNVITLTNIQPSQAGVYTLRVTNLCCGGTMGVYPTATSSNAVLTVGNPGPLTVARDSLQQIFLNWEGVFFLQSATNVSGPFTDLPGPVVFSPYTNIDTSGPRFFRLRN